jgi:hypothetical protein
MPHRKATTQAGSGAAKASKGVAKASKGVATEMGHAPAPRPRVEQSLQRSIDIIEQHYSNLRQWNIAMAFCTVYHKFGMAPLNGDWNTEQLQYIVSGLPDSRGTSIYTVPWCMSTFGYVRHEGLCWAHPFYGEVVVSRSVDRIDLTATFPNAFLVWLYYIVYMRYLSAYEKGNLTKRVNEVVRQTGAHEAVPTGSGADVCEEAEITLEAGQEADDELDAAADADSDADPYAEGGF